ncbi:MAG: hypothetical protein ACLU4N_26515 [Butyricimonas faecihominis]
MRTLYIICFFLLTGGIVGCYEDKGNYIIRSYGITDGVNNSIKLFEFG